MPMYANARALIDDLGGYRSVAVRLGVKATTLHTHMVAGAFPAKWFCALRDLAVEADRPVPQEELFSFARLPDGAEDAA